MTCPFSNEMSPGYNAAHISGEPQSWWASTDLNCIEIKQRDRPSNTFSRGQRSGQLRLGRDNRSVRYRRRFIEEPPVKFAIERTTRGWCWFSVRGRHGRTTGDVSRSIVRRVRGAVGVRPGNSRASPLIIGGIQVASARTNATPWFWGRNGAEAESTIVRLPEPIILRVEIGFEMRLESRGGVSGILIGDLPRGL